MFPLNGGCCCCCLLAGENSWKDGNSRVGIPGRVLLLFGYSFKYPHVPTYLAASQKKWSPPLILDHHKIKFKKRLPFTDLILNVVLIKFITLY
jgi:hypothetical protein